MKQFLGVRVAKVVVDADKLVNATFGNVGLRIGSSVKEDEKADIRSQ